MGERSPRSADDAGTLAHVAELDGVRGLAILIVLWWHYYTNQLVLGEGTLAWWFARAGVLGWSGVDLFFVLSGFLLGSILLRNRGAENFYAAFYVRRICRIVPLYLVLLATYLVCALWLRVSSNPGHDWLFDRAMPFWSYATFTQNFLMARSSDYGAQFMAVTWSLAVEEQFYLILPLMVALLPPRLLPWIAGMLVIAAAALRMLFDARGLDVHFVLAPARMDSLYAGVLLAWMLQQPRIAAALRAPGRFPEWLLVLLFAGVVILTVDPGIFGFFNHSWLIAFYAMLVAFAAGRRGSLVARCLRARWLAGMGVVSYAVYLFHQPVNGLLHAALLREGPQIEDWRSGLATLAALGVTLALATLTLRVVERPAIRWGRNLNWGRRAGEHASIS